MNKISLVKPIVSLFLFAAFILPNAAFAQTAPARGTAEVFAAIRKEGMENSTIMHSVHVLTDLYGPRLTGSPNHVNSARWTARQMTEWGFDKAELEPFEFGFPGWVSERAVGLMLRPVQDTLTFEVLAWTPSTRGVVVADAVNIVPPTTPIQSELDEFFAKAKSEIEGKIVLIGKPAKIPVQFELPQKRISDEVLKRRFDPDAQQQGPQGQFGGPQNQNQRQGALTAAQVDLQLDKFLLDNGALVRVNDAAREHGQIRAFNNRTFDVDKVVPTVILRNEDFGRISRLLENKNEVRLEFDIRNRTVPSGVTSYNVVGEITGTDKRDEVIMLGGHLDSWHAATGATDNAVGCAIMMEAARILKKLDLKPRRTVRVALWSGEEQGLIGSQAYVKRHFGSAEDPTASHSKFGGYFNIDSGTGKARGMSIFGPPETATILREALKPFEDFGFFGVISTRSRNIGGSDHTSFNNAGLPGIGVQQDPIEYGSHTWHTNLDTYERIIEDDVKKSAIIIASAVYVLAMRDELVPRFTKEAMPPKPTPTPQRNPAPNPSPSPTPRG